MASLLFYSGKCEICKALLKQIKTYKLEKHFTMKLVEELEIEEIINSGIEFVPTIINNDVYYEKEQCNDFIAGLMQYIKYSETANLIQTTNNNNVKADDNCAICMGKIEVGETMHTFCCGHKFHKECSVAWRKIKNNCPTCGKYLVVTGTGGILYK